MQHDQLMQLPYSKFLDEVLRDHPDGSWHNTQEWLMRKYTSQQIAAMYCKLYEQLIIFTPDGEEEAPEADLLRDQMDIFWYATTVSEIDKILTTMLEEKQNVLVE